MKEKEQAIAMELQNLILNVGVEWLHVMHTSSELRCKMGLFLFA